jgi:hypothetical protein
MAGGLPGAQPVRPDTAQRQPYPHPARDSRNPGYCEAANVEGSIGKSE